MSNKFRLAALTGASALFLALLTGCSSSNEQAQEVTELTVYSGRSEEFIAPFFAQWESESGIKLNVRYGDSAELAAQILEEATPLLIYFFLKMLAPLAQLPRLDCLPS